MGLTDYMADPGRGECKTGASPAYLLTGQVLEPDKDTEKNHLKIKLLNMPDDRNILDNVPVASPCAGKEWGSFFLPETGDLVLVFFDNPQLRNPVAAHCIYPENSSFAKEWAKDKNTGKAIGVKNGSLLSFDGEKGKGRISLSTSKKQAFAIEEEKGILSLQDSKAKNRLEIREEDGKVSLTAEKEIVLECGKSKLTLGKDGSVKIVCEQVTLEAKTVSVKAKSKADIQGQEVSVKGKTGLSINCSAKAEIKSSGPLKLNGAVIQLN